MKVGIKMAEGIPSAKAMGIGIISTISISKTKKITARRKKRKEKGKRADFLGSKPHSKGEHFSRSLDERAARAQAAKPTTTARVSPKDKMKSLNSIPQK